MAEAAFVKVAEVGELSPGDMKMVEVGDDQVLVSRELSTRVTTCVATLLLRYLEATWTDTSRELSTRVTTCVATLLLRYLEATWTGRALSARCMARCLM